MFLLLLSSMNKLYSSKCILANWQIKIRVFSFSFHLQRRSVVIRRIWIKLFNPVSLLKQSIYLCKRFLNIKSYRMYKDMLKKWTFMRLSNLNQIKIKHKTKIDTYPISLTKCYHLQITKCYYTTHCTKTILGDTLRDSHNVSRTSLIMLRVYIIIKQQLSKPEEKNA